MRAWRPAAASVSVVADGGKPVPLTQIHPAGVFEGRVEKAMYGVKATGHVARLLRDITA